jgi:hypothetical protein
VDKERAGESQPASSRTSLFNNFNDTPALRLYDYGHIVYDCISVTRSHMIFARKLVICYPALRKDCADPHLFPISKRRMTLVYDILAKTGPLFNTEDSPNSSGRGTYDSSDDRSDRSCGLATDVDSLFGSADSALCVQGNG